jgi:ribosomal protein L20
MSESEEIYQVKIYKIVNTINNEFYIGSTKHILKSRLQNHRKDCVKYPTRNMLYEMMNQYDKKECFRIVLIEMVNVSSRAEQNKYEQKYINELKPTLNKINASGQKCIHNRIKNNCKECSPIFCESCGETFSKVGYTVHCKTNKHIDYCKIFYKGLKTNFRNN